MKHLLNTARLTVALVAAAAAEGLEALGYRVLGAADVLEELSRRADPLPVPSEWTETDYEFSRTLLASLPPEVMNPA